MPHRRATKRFGGCEHPSQHGALRCPTVIWRPAACLSNRAALAAGVFQDKAAGTHRDAGSAPPRHLSAAAARGKRNSPALAGRHAVLQAWRRTGGSRGRRANCATGERRPPGAGPTALLGIGSRGGAPRPAGTASGSARPMRRKPARAVRSAEDAVYWSAIEAGAHGRPPRLRRRLAWPCSDGGCSVRDGRWFRLGWPSASRQIAGGSPCTCFARPD